ncbi:polysaccharide deacetylase [Orbus hercynius]|uniref:Polysaccharide deacetylase n=1 Tax=Orbus hercynius TaxID=593135 RepID=A0A495RBF0_9GAMM|nr:polysaccharide deacetylase family protein [Orbus hercynius]RKS84803.1 polysaccharide deacetylase [Orbus hercynius]
MGNVSARQRLTYEPITQRKFKLPNNARVAVWVIVNVENWLPENPQPRTVLPPPMGVNMLPDIPNWCWHEYGMRVGFWRFLEVLKKRDIKATLAVNGSALDVYRPACQAALNEKWEFMGHGFVQKPMHRVEDERQAIIDTINAIKSFTGSAPLGWESPGIAETSQTLDLLQEAGIKYVADWVLDDQPVTLKTRSGEITSVPYTVEINDVVMSAIQQQRSDEIYLRGKDHFDCLYQEGKTIPRVMAITIHPYLTGVPHRIGYLEALLDYIMIHPDVVMCTGGEIMDFYHNSKK